jgi:arylsulfate sulfotransferase
MARDFLRLNLFRISFTVSAVIFCVLPGCKKSEPAARNTFLLPPVTDGQFYNISINDTGAAKSEILFALNPKNTNLGNLFIVDERGSIKMEKAVGQDVQNLQKWVIGGKTRYTFFLSLGGATTLDSIPGTELGYEYICDSALNVIDSVKLLSYKNIDAGIQDKVDVHEFILLGDHHYICETYYRELPDNIPDSLHPETGIRVSACVIQEVDNGNVVFQWDGTNYPEFYAASRENNDFRDLKITHDYMHLNSICVDSTDNNLIVSFRNLNEIVKLNRVTGQIMWRLGGPNSDFPLTSDQVFLRQHYARVIENGKTLIFVDNGLAGVRAYSRILEFQLDEQARTISSFKSFTIPDTFVQFAGSVQKEGDEYFIGGGSGNYAIRVNYKTNEVLFRLNFKISSYRVLKYN